MRWYCVHPELPAHAKLRVRVAPSSAAPELERRLGKGRAIGVVAPVFEVVEDGEDVVQTWLQVAVPDRESGGAVNGFMMAGLPDGTPLLTTWQRAGFISCCFVASAKAFLFDAPTASAEVVGLVGSTSLPYGVIEIDGSRALISHGEFGEVWINTAELDPVCMPLHHPGCSGRMTRWRDLVLKENANWRSCAAVYGSASFVLHPERGAAIGGPDSDPHLPVQGG